MSNITIHLAFVEYEKPIMESLDNARIDSRYTKFLTDIYDHVAISVTLDEDLKTDKIRIERGNR